ncbi:hypothetical protein QFZ81_003070 [Paenibacillus sp. V4I9]|uniref:SIR2 family protein n=1 Tax=Paenibacillus sp. V4I9 TaxID=3042308 RepID=UPI002788FFA8|nr:SIR2 family protein [Paenibacillus sp. V4I9]MDQ0887982.1 hypothetical protein [Paenibacillus sp. V4I9]
MWITKDIKLPDEIIDAQKKGELVIFAGAGVSTPPPSNLPNFEKLAIAIANDFVPFDNTISIDTFLGKLMNRRIKVHEKTIELLTLHNSKPCSYHSNIFKLFDKDKIKIVTTNFDDHFKNASEGIEIPYYSAPALPLGRDFTGVVHLHGSVTKRPQDLVLTDSDFGRAYFTDGWATNFLRGMFSNYVVLFIGFSANDPVIKYIARGLGSNNRNRYAFTEEGQHDHWNHLQINYIEYPRSRHDLLEEAIGSWVVRTQMGVFEQRMLIKDIVEKPPEYNEVEESYISHQLKDHLGAQHFFEFAKDFQWVEWMYNNKSLDTLFNSDNTLTPYKHLQAMWFSSFLANEPEKMMKIIMEKGVVSNYLKQYIIRELHRQQDGLSPKSIGKWLPVFLDHVNYHKKEDGLELISHDMEYPKNKELILILFEYLTRPLTKYKKKFSLSESSYDELVDVEIEIQGDMYSLGELWRKSILPNLEYYAVPLMNIFINQLQMVTFLLKGTGHGNWDPLSFSRSAIEPHEQDRYPDSMDLVIDGCRDVLEYLIQHDGKLAQSLINQCLLSESKLLKRISIHSYKFITEITVDEKIVWLVNNNLLFLSDYRHEVYQYIKYIYPELSLKSKRTFLKQVNDEYEKRSVDESLIKENVEYEEFNLYYWLTQSDDKCRLAQRAFLNAKKKNKRFKVRNEYPDFTHWSSSSGFSPVTSKVTITEILSKDPCVDKDLNWLMTYQDENYMLEKREGFLDAVSSAIESELDWGLKLLRRLITPPKKWKTDLWKAILNGFKEAKLKNEEWVEFLNVLIIHRNLNEFRFEIANLFDKATKTNDIDFQLSINLAIKIFHKIFSSARTSDISSTEDALTQAINHPIGKFTEFFCYVYIKVFNDEKANKQILNEIKTSIFSKMIVRTDEQSIMGKIILANRLHIFLTIDEDWSKKNLIPLFDPNHDKEMAKKAWNGYAYGGRWNERILESLFSKLVLIIPIAIEMNTVTQQSIYRLCASILFYSTEFNEPLRKHFFTTGSENQFNLLTNELTNYLEQLEESAKEKAWREWINNYIKNRLENLPVVISDDELSEIVEWLPFLEPMIEEFVSLIITTRNVRLRNAHIIYQISTNEIGKKHPNTLLIYLEFILRDNGIEFYSDEAYNVMSQILESLQNKHDYFPLVCAHLLKSNVPKAVELLARYNEKF